MEPTVLSTKYLDIKVVALERLLYKVQADMVNPTIHVEANMSACLAQRSLAHHVPLSQLWRI